MVTLEKPVQMAEIVDAKSPQLSEKFSFFDLPEKSCPLIIPLRTLYYHLLASCIHLYKYEEGRTAAKKGLALTEQSSFAWFSFQELLCLLYIRTEHFHQAYILLRYTSSQTGFSDLPLHVRENWTIYHGFILFLLSSNTEPGSIFRSPVLLCQLSSRISTLEEDPPLSQLFIRFLLRSWDKESDSSSNLYTANEDKREIKNWFDYLMSITLAERTNASPTLTYQMVIRKLLQTLEVN